MGFPASCRPTSYETGALHYFVNSEALYGTVTLDLDKSFAICCCNCRVKPKLLLVQTMPRLGTDGVSVITSSALSVESSIGMLLSVTTGRMTLGQAVD